jgi:hypothetical protein
MLVISASVMRRLSLDRSEPAKKSGQNIPKNRCRTTIAERMVDLFRRGGCERQCE